MIRFPARLIGSLLLAVAVVFAVGDIARSLTENGVYLTPLAEAAGYFGAVPPAAVEGGAVLEAANSLWALVAGWPASPTIGVLALLFLFIGRPKRRSQDRLAR